MQLGIIQWLEPLARARPSFERGSDGKASIDDHGRGKPRDVPYNSAACKSAEQHGTAGNTETRGITLLVFCRNTAASRVNGAGRRT